MEDQRQRRQRLSIIASYWRRLEILNAISWPGPPSSGLGLALAPGRVDSYHGYHRPGPRADEGPPSRGRPAELGRDPGYPATGGGVAAAERAAATFGLAADPVVVGPRTELYLVWAMNLPNTLTLLRIFFVPLLVAALVQENVMFTIAGYTFTKEWLALAIFLAAAATDLLDGYLARRWSQVTTIGTLLDPIADKLLISAALISLVQVRVLPGWMAILIVAREFAVSGLRSIAAAEGYTIKASDLGKTKMLSQVVAVSCMLLSIRHRALRLPGMILMWGVVFFAVLSAVSYFRKFWRKVDESVKKRRRRELLQLERRRQRALLRQRKGSSASAPETL